MANRPHGSWHTATGSGEKPLVISETCGSMLTPGSGLQATDQDPVAVDTLSGSSITGTKKQAAPVTDSVDSYCKACQKSCDKPLICGKCKIVTYCCLQCQKTDWSFHKISCAPPTQATMIARSMVIKRAKERRHDDRFT